MACECGCKNTGSEYCLGTCEEAKEIINRAINPEHQIRAQEDSFTQKQCEQIRSMLKKELSVSRMLDAIWVDGFVTGFREGTSNG